MKRGPISYRRSNWTKEQIAHIRQVERAFHIRAFGEELARVNLDMTFEQRLEYLGWMREARRALPSTGSSINTGS